MLGEKTRVDDQRVAFPGADRVPLYGPFTILRVPAAIEINRPLSVVELVREGHDVVVDLDLTDINGGQGQDHWCREIDALDAWSPGLIVLSHRRNGFVRHGVVKEREDEWDSNRIGRGQELAQPETLESRRARHRARLVRPVYGDFRGHR